MKEYTSSYEWIERKGNIAIVGISKFALEQFGEVVKLSLPEIGKIVKEDQEVCIIESSKSALDITTPISGKIVEVNEKLLDNIDLLNKDPENKGWLFKIDTSI